MKNTENTETVANRSTAITTLPATAFEDNTLDISNLSAMEQVELAREILKADAEFEAITLPQVSSGDILGREINVLDAQYCSIIDNGDEKLCVRFVCEYASGDDQGEQFTVLKSSNMYNNAWADRFNRRRGMASLPINGYNFVTSDKHGKTGNAAIILLKYSAARAKAV